MVVGVWELVLFLWSHPIISCLVLLLFSPPFFPIIVYFSPLLICTGLAVIAMVSMNMGQRAGRTDLRNDTRRVEPAVHVEMLVKPARESWFQWMKMKEEKAKAWVDSRFFSQDKCHFRDKSAPAQEEEPSMVVYYNDNNEGYHISSYMELSRPTPVLRSKALSLLQINRDVFPLLAEVAKASNDMSYSFVPESEDIKSIPSVQVPKEDPEFEISSFERRSPPSLAVQLSEVETEFCKELGVSSSLQEEEVVCVGNVQTVVEQEILSAPKAESLNEEPPTADYDSEPRSLNEMASEVPLLLLPPKEVLAPVDMNDSMCKAPDEKDGFLVIMHNRIGETLKSIAFEQSSLFTSDIGRITKPLPVWNGTVSVDSGILTRLEAVQNDYGTTHIQPSSGLSGSRHMAEDVLVSPKLSASGEDRKACPEAEGATHGFSPSNESQVIRPIKRFIATEKIIYVDEPSDFTTVQSQSMVAETGKLGTSPIHERIGQIVAVEAEPHESSLLKDRSPKGGLDENIESCRNVPPTTRSNSEPMALVSRSLLEASSLLETSALVVQSIPYPDELELLAAYMEPVMSTDNDAALTTSGSVLDKSYSLNNTFTGEDDDLTARFYALKKSMSLHTTRRWEEPISLSIAEGNSSVVPVYIPDVVTPVERNPSSESLVVWEKKESRPRLSSRSVESVESITARLSKKFTPNLRNDTIVTPPPTRPAPTLPAPALPPIDSTAPVQSDTNVEVTDGPVDVATGDNKLPATAENPHSKKTLTSFLSRRREKLVSSYSSKGERGTKMSSEATDAMTSIEISAEDRDEGSASTSSRLLKEKMISPLKRVFSMDANAGSSRKGDTLRESSVNSSPLKEKQSVINRSKTTVMKLFSSEGGTKVELPEVPKLAALDTISLRKPKSVSRAGEQHAEFGEGQNGVVRDGLSLPTTPRLAPLSELHAIEDVEVKSELQALPGFEAAACAETAEDSQLAETVEKADRKLAETVEEESSRLEPLPSSPTEERMTPPSIDLEAPDDCTKVRGDEVTKGSSEKKFSWSWSKSEKHVLPGIAATTLYQTAEQLDSKLEPPPSCNDEGMPPATLATGGPDDSAPVRGDRVNKSSREKKFLWSWTKSEKQLLPRSAAGSLTEIPEELDSRLEAKLEEYLLSGTAAAASAETAEYLDSKLKPESEKQLLPGIAAASPTETAEDLDSKLTPESEKQLLPGIAVASPAESAESEGNLEQAPSCNYEGMLPATLATGGPDSSAPVRGDRVNKSSREKKFLWSWNKSEKQVLPRSAAGPLTEIPEELDSKLEAKLKESLLSGTAAGAPAGTAEDLDSKLKPESEKQLQSGIAAASPAETAEDLDSKLTPESEKQLLPGIAAASPAESAESEGKLEQAPSCNDEGMPPATLATGGPDSSAPVRGDRVNKSSREKKFLWSWNKSEKQLLPRSAAGPLTEIPKELDSKLEAKLEESLLSGTAAAAPAGTAEDLDSKLKPESEKQLLSGIAAASPAETAEDFDSKLTPESEKQLLPGIAASSPAESAESEGKLEPVPSSPTEEKISPTTLDAGEPDDSVRARGHRVTKSSGEKKFAWTWTKKTRSNEQQDTPVDQLRSLDDVVSFSGKGVDEEAREILLSPLPGFHSSPGMSLVSESADISVPKDEDDSLEFKCVRPDSSSKLHDPQKTDSPHKKPSSSWWAPKADHPTLEKVVSSKEKKVSTSWWSRRNGRADSKAVLSSSDLAPTDINSSSNNVVTDRTADSLEKSGPLSSLSERGNNIDDVIPDDDAAAGAAPRPRHRRERSDSLPVSRGKFTRLRGRQTSLSEIALPRTPELELSPASSSVRAPHYNTIEKSTFFSMPRSYECHLHEDVMKETRNSDPLNGSNSNNTGWGTNSTPLTSYQIRPSSVRTLDLANEQQRVSPFHRTDLDVNSRLYRNSPSGAEIRITDKLKVPLEEVLSLLSTGDSDEQHNTMTADSGTGDAVAGDLQKASSSSSSEEEFSSEEEWSATSDDEDESQRQQQKHQQFNSLPAAGRIRRKLPHYIFSNGEATAN